MYRLKFILTIALPLILWKCKDAPESDMALVGTPLPADSVNSGMIYLVDTTTSFVSWVGTEPLGWHNGTFRIKSGNLKIMENEINQATSKKELTTGDIIIDIFSVDILDLRDNPGQYDKLKSHLLSPDFLDAVRHPVAEFEMTSLEVISKDTLTTQSGEFITIAPTHVMKGNLTMRGKTLGIEFPVHIDIRNYKFEASAKFNIDRTLWDIKHRNENDPVARAKDGIIHNTVNVGFEILARPANNASLGL